MIYILLQGQLHRDPTPQTSKNGKEYASALLRVGDGDAMLFVNVRAFGEAADALLGLTMGDAISVQGKAEIGVYEAKDGTHRPSINVMAAILTPLRRIKPTQPVQRPASDERSRQQRLAGAWSAASGDPNDSIDF